ncbi:uncharacterized protein LOC144580380 [Callithrix jacchus]
MRLRSSSRPDGAEDLPPCCRSCCRHRLSPPQRLLRRRRLPYPTTSSPAHPPLPRRAHCFFPGFPFTQNCPAPPPPPSYLAILPSHSFVVSFIEWRRNFQANTCLVLPERRKLVSCRQSGTSEYGKENHCLSPVYMLTS